MRNIKIANGICLFLIAVTVAFWALVVFGSFHPLNRCDWDKFFTYQEASRKIILEYKQLPLWNPYIAGGMPWLAHPESNFISPFFIPVLLLGSIKGTVSIYFLQAMAACFGVWAVSRQLGLSRALSLANSVFALHAVNMITYVGSLTFLNISHLPWAFYFFNKAGDGKKYLFASSLVIAHCLYAGSVYAFIIILMAMFLFAVFVGLAKREAITLRNFVFTSISAVCFASPKLFPMIELLLRYFRSTELPPMPAFLDYNAVSAGLSQLRHIFWTNKPLYSSVSFLNETSIVGYRIPLPVLAIAFAAQFAIWRKYKFLVILNIIFIFLALGDNSPVNLWRILHFLLPSYKNPKMFIAPLILSVSFSFGLALRQVQQKLALKQAVIDLIGIALWGVFIFNVFQAAGSIFTKENTQILSYDFNKGDQSGFFQVRGKSYRMFDTVYNNHGIINGYDSIGSMFKTGVLAVSDPGYKGEFFLFDGERSLGFVHQTLFSPNKMSFCLNLDRDSRLAINQNYFKGWHISTGEKVFDYNGLIAAKVSKDEKSATFYYLPVQFILGVAVVSAQAVFLFAFFRFRRSLDHSRAI